MPIVYEGDGDIFHSGCQTITCPVNTKGVMGKGLALAFKNRMPWVFNHYRHLCFEGQLKVGQPAICHAPHPNTPSVLLFATKQHWINPSRKEWIEEGLDYVREAYQELGIQSLALPALGCGLGQLDYYLDVRPLIYDALEDIPIPVKVILPCPYNQPWAAR